MSLGEGRVCVCVLVCECVCARTFARLRACVCVRGNTVQRRWACPTHVDECVCGCVCVCVRERVCACKFVNVRVCGNGAAYISKGGGLHHTCG